MTAMLPDDVAAFLERQTRLFLLTRRRDGGPTIHPMTGFFADGRVAMSTYRKSVKARNVERDARVACLVVDGYGKDEVRAVLVRGRGRLETATLAARPTSSPAAPKVSDTITDRVADRMASGKRVLLAIEPDTAAFVGRLECE